MSKFLSKYIKIIGLMLFTSILLVTSFVANADTDTKYSVGKEYKIVDFPKSTHPKVIVFSSFYCHVCYDFEIKYKMLDKLKANLPANTEFVYYHLPFLGGKSGEYLTEAWSVAVAAGISEKIMPRLFVEAMDNNSIHSMSDIIKLFVEYGVSEKEFNSIKSGLKASLFAKEQANMYEKYNINGTPTFVVNNKYVLLPNGIYEENMQAEKYIEKYIDVIKQTIKL